MPVRSPFPPNNVGDQAREQEIYRAQDGRLDKGNAAPRAFSLGTKVSQNAQAGNLDAVFLTVSFPTSSAATQTASASHVLGRHPNGFEVVNQQGVANFATYTATNVRTQATNAYFAALVYADPVTATVRIW